MWNVQPNHSTIKSQVKPDFIPRSPAGPGGDSYTRPLSASILAARTTSPTTTSISPTSSTSMTLPTRAEKSVGGGSSAPISTTPAGNHLGQQQQIAHQLEAASANVRLWRRFSILALDAPSTAELRTVFSRACSDAFGGNGPVSSALSGPRSDTVLLSSETWTTIDGLGGIATEFLHRLHLRLRDKTTESGKSYYTGASAPSRFDDNDYEVVGAAGTLAGVHLDYFTLGRLLQPLVMARTCGISTPAAILRLWCHEVRINLTFFRPGFLAGYFPLRRDGEEPRHSAVVSGVAPIIERIRREERPRVFFYSSPILARLSPLTHICVRDR